MATATDEQVRQAQEDELARARARHEEAAGAAQERDDEAAIDAMNAKPDAERPADDARSIEEIAAEGEEKQVPPMQLALPGTKENITLTAGGARPTSSEVRLMGGRLPVEGQFEKGEIVTLIVEAKVGEVAFIDTTDDWGNVQKTVRAHKARMLSVKRVSQ